jgi:hypothetical protein
MESLTLNFAAAILPFATPLVVFALMKLVPGINRAIGMMNNPNKGPIDRLKKRLTGAKERADAKIAASNLEKPTPGFSDGKLSSARRRAWQLGTASGRLR